MKKFFINQSLWIVFWIVYGLFFWTFYVIITEMIAGRGLESWRIQGVLETGITVSPFFWGFGGLIGAIGQEIVLKYFVRASTNQLHLITTAIYWSLFWWVMLLTIALISMNKSVIGGMWIVGVGVNSMMPIIVYSALGGVLGTLMIERVVKRRFD